MKQPRRFRKFKLFLFITALLLVIYAGYQLLRIINGWFETHAFQFNPPVVVTFNPPIEIVERKIEGEKIISLIEAIPNPEDLETDPEKLIYKYFGIENYKMAIAVSRCEGLNHPADGFNVNNNNSIDVGYMRINSVHFKTEGCSLLEVATPEGNIACGYKVWDRADGKEGNKKGSFSPWVGFTNGCALTKYE